MDGSSEQRRERDSLFQSFGLEPLTTTLINTSSSAGSLSVPPRKWTTISPSRSDDADHGMYSRDRSVDDLGGDRRFEVALDPADDDGFLSLRHVSTSGFVG